MALFSAVMMLASKKPIHSVLFLTLTFFAIAGHYVLLNAQFLAVVHVIVYAGAIMVLFIFVIMMLNIGLEEELENKWLRPKMWIFPTILALILLGEFIYVVRESGYQALPGEIISPKQVGISLFTTYLLGTEIAAVLLLAGIIGAYHLGKRKKNIIHRFLIKK